MCHSSSATTAPVAIASARTGRSGMPVWPPPDLVVATRQLFEGDRGSDMLLRFSRSGRLDRITEEMLSERRARQIPLDAYRRGNQFKVHFDLPGVDAASSS